MAKHLAKMIPDPTQFIKIRFGFHPAHSYQYPILECYLNETYFQWYFLEKIRPMIQEGEFLFLFNIFENVNSMIECMGIQNILTEYDRFQINFAPNTIEIIINLMKIIKKNISHLSIKDRKYLHEVTDYLKEVE